MPDFSDRSTEREIIDDMTLDERTIAGILRELEVINRYLGGYATTLSALDELLPASLDRIRILDVGAGGGDMARRLVEWGRARRQRVEVVSVDLSHGAVVFARDALRDVPEATVVQADVLALPFASGTFDVGLCALFLHHFEQEPAARILRALNDASRYGVVVNDLHRHPLAYAGIRALTTIFPTSEIVRNDGPLSVRRAFTREDFEDLSRRTGLDLDVRWRWAFRYQVIIRKERAEEARC